jgi:hypothetical protein
MADEPLPGSAPVGRRIRLRPQRIRPSAPETLPDSEASESEVAPNTPVQHASATVAAVFGLVGLLGFLPGLINLEDLAMAGHHSDALLFGLFSVSILHNAMHLLFAVGGFVLARTPRGARLFLLTGGAFYLLLAGYGTVIDHGGAANVIPVNSAGNWLHLVLGTGMLGLAALPGRAAR